jgi:steroid 5-alpha reductase family enzyme
MKKREETEQIISQKEKRKAYLDGFEFGMLMTIFLSSSIALGGLENGLESDVLMIIIYSCSMFFTLFIFRLICDNKEKNTKYKDNNRVKKLSSYKANNRDNK